MLCRNAEAGSDPARVSLERLSPDQTLVRLADNIRHVQREDDAGEQDVVCYDEVSFYLPADRLDETQESIEAGFAEWWAYGAAGPEHTVTLEERVTALEDMYLAGLL